MVSLAASYRSSRHVYLGYRTPKPVTRIVTTSCSGGPVLPMIVDLWRFSAGVLISARGLSVIHGAGDQCSVMLRLQNIVGGRGQNVTSSQVEKVPERRLCMHCGWFSPDVTAYHKYIKSIYYMCSDTTNRYSLPVDLIPSNQFEGF